MNATERRSCELASHLGHPLPSGTPAVLARFTELVRTWNARLDLTAAREETALTEVLFADAIVASDRALVPEGSRVLDVGSGAGAPALSLALLRPDVTVVMVEPIRKRVAFLRTAIGTLDLASRVSVIETRVEPARPVAPSAADVSSARATFPPEEWLGAGLAMAPACLVYLTGEPPTRAGASLVQRVDYTLPWSRAPRVLARFERA